jgi:hypothetical protein
MRVAVVFLALAVCAYATQLHVTLNLGGGAPDPEWIVTGDVADRIVSLLPQAPREVQRPIPWYRMGYRGFEVVADDGMFYEIYDNPLAETALLFSGLSQLSTDVADHVKGEVKRVAALSPAEKEPVAILDERAPLACNPPVRGSDNNTVYNPQTDCDGCFVSHCSENNCYNYGNDVATNTFAQPGRGSGSKWKTNTCNDMRDAAIRDGLSWAGTTLPTANPKVGHYLALLIWPNTNFHWIRFDSVPAGKWSHKAGGTPVKNVDNRGLAITDPSKSDFAPWTQFCGYMIGVPSNVTIN